MTQLSELIQQKRQERGISRRELARRCRISESEIRQIEGGKGNPKFETFEKLAGPLGLSVEELLLTRRESLGLSVAASAGLVSWKLSSADQHARTLDHVQQSLYDQVLKAGQDRDIGPVPMEADEALAEAAHAKGDWASEELLWLLAERSAAKREDWLKWANAMLRAGQTKLNLSKFDVAKCSFITVLTQPEVRTDAKLEARVRMAWVYFEEEKYHEANMLLSRAEREVKELLRDREGDPYFDAIREMVFHFKGRTLAALYKLENNEEFAKEALHYLNLSYKLDEKYHSTQALGFDLLRQIPILIDQERTREANYSLNQSEELLGRQGTAQGHINYHKALLRSVGALGKKAGQRLPKSEELLEEAAEGFMYPIFYPRGLAHVYCERSTLTLESDVGCNSTSLDRLKQAFEYGFVGSILHPYAENVGYIGVMARALYSNLGRSRGVFLDFTTELIEKVITMDQEPFTVLKLYDPSMRLWTIQEALVNIESEIKGMVKWPSKESLFSPMTDDFPDFIPIKLT